MGDFEDAYARWRGQSFPSGSARNSLDELHADLALADTWVAEAVIPFVEHGVHHPARVNVSKELRQLRTRAIELGQVGNADDNRLADSYGDYAALLQRVYEGFMAHAQLHS